MLKTNILVYTGSPRLTEIEWKFGYNPKTKRCDLDDGTGHIKRTTKDINRVTYGLDFGPGVYLTGDKGLACSWACTQMNTENENDDIPEMLRNGALHTYRLNLEGLKILDLSSDEHSLLEYIAVILYNRTFFSENKTIVNKKGVEYILENYLPEDIDTYDVICGPRADSLYSLTFDDFITNQIGINQLRELIPLGNLGEQIVLVSKESLSHIEYIEPVMDLSEEDKETYFEHQKYIYEKDYLKHQDITSKFEGDVGYTLQQITEKPKEEIQEIKLNALTDKYHIVEKNR